MTIDYSRLEKSLKNLEIQHEHLLSLLQHYPTYIQEGMAESVIQRFEVCYDVLWKLLRRYLIEKLGIVDAPNSPRGIIRLADQNQLLASGSDQWQAYVDGRIATTHDYDGKNASDTLRLVPSFISDAISLYATMTGNKWV